MHDNFGSCSTKVKHRRAVDVRRVKPRRGGHGKNLIARAPTEPQQNGAWDRHAAFWEWAYSRCGRHLAIPEHLVPACVVCAIDDGLMSLQQLGSPTVAGTRSEGGWLAPKNVTVLGSDSIMIAKNIRCARGPQEGAGTSRGGGSPAAVGVELGRPSKRSVYGAMRRASSYEATPHRQASRLAFGVHAVGRSRRGESVHVGEVRVIHAGPKPRTMANRG